MWIENLQRIRKESEYVDSVGLRLNDLLKRTEDLKGGMGELVGAFREENDKSLSELKDAFSGQMTEEYHRFGREYQELQEKLESFQASVNDLVQSRDRVADEKMVSFQEQLSTVEKSFHVRIENAAQEAVALESSVFDELKEMLSGHRDSLESNWSGTVNDLNSSISST